MRRPKEHHKKEHYRQKKDRSYITIMFTVIAFFVGLGLIVFYYSKTLIDILNLSKFIVAFAVVGFLLPLRFYSKWFHFIKYEVIIFNVIGIAPFFTGLFLIFNYGYSSNPTTYKYRVEKIYIDGDPGFETVGVVLENNFFSGEQKIVKISDPNPKEMLKNHYLQLTIADGLFGFQVLKEKVFVK